MTLTVWRLAVADDLERDARADRRVGDQVAMTVWSGVTSLAVDPKDDVALLDARRGPRARRDDRADDLAAVLRQAEAVGDVLVERLEADAEIAALRPLAAAQRVDHRLGSLGRDGEADADAGAGRRDQRRIDADDVAVEVEHRAAAVAHVDGGVGLDVAVVGAGAGDPAVKRRDDAGGDGAAKAVGIADGDDPVADPRLGAVAPVDEGQVAALDLQQREVGRLVAADDPRRIFLAVGR